MGPDLLDAGEVDGREGRASGERAVSDLGDPGHADDGQGGAAGEGVVPNRSVEVQDDGIERRAAGERLESDGREGRDSGYGGVPIERLGGDGGDRPLETEIGYLRRYVEVGDGGVRDLHDGDLEGVSGEDLVSDSASGYGLSGFGDVDLEVRGVVAGELVACQSVGVCLHLVAVLVIEGATLESGGPIDLETLGEDNVVEALAVSESAVRQLDRAALLELEHLEGAVVEGFEAYARDGGRDAHIAEVGDVPALVGVLQSLSGLSEGASGDSGDGVGYDQPLLGAGELDQSVHALVVQDSGDRGVVLIVGRHRDGREHGAVEGVEPDLLDGLADEYRGQGLATVEGIL